MSGNLKAHAISFMALVGVILAVTAIIVTPDQTEVLMQISDNLMNSTFIKLVASIPSIFS